METFYKQTGLSKYTEVVALFIILLPWAGELARGCATTAHATRRQRQSLSCLSGDPVPSTCAGVRTATGALHLLAHLVVAWHRVSWDWKPLSFQEVGRLGHWIICVIIETSKSGGGRGGDERVSATASTWGCVFSKKPLLRKLMGVGIRAEVLGGLGWV